MITTNKTIKKKNIFSEWTFFPALLFLSVLRMHIKPRPPPKQTHSVTSEWFSERGWVERTDPVWTPPLLHLLHSPFRLQRRAGVGGETRSFWVWGLGSFVIESAQIRDRCSCFSVSKWRRFCLDGCHGVDVDTARRVSQQILYFHCHDLSGTEKRPTAKHLNSFIARFLLHKMTKMLRKKNKKGFHLWVSLQAWFVPDKTEVNIDSFGA